MKKIFILCLFLFLVFTLAAQDEYRDLFDDLSADLEESSTGSNESSTGSNESSTGSNESSIEENTTEETTSKKKTTFNTEFVIMLTGDHGFEFHIPVVPEYMNFDGYIKSPKVKNDFGVEIYFKNLKLITHWEFNLILNGWGNWAEFLEIIPLENYISWSPWKFSFGLGFQKYNWGTADLINPTDNINLQDIRNPFNPRKLSTFSLYIGFFPHRTVSLEAIYIPFYLMPPVDLTDLVESGMGGAEYDVESAIKPEYFGLGGKTNFFLKYADFSVSYLTKVEPIYSPVLELHDPTSDPLPYYKISHANFLYRRIHYIGADFRTNIGMFGLWAEACYSISEDYVMNRVDIRNHQFSWALGFDINYGPNSEFYANFQYFGYVNPFFDKDYYQDYSYGRPELNRSKDYYETYYYRTITDALAGWREGLMQGISINMKWPVLNGKLTPAIKAIYSIPLWYDTDYELRFGNLYVNPLLEINPMEAFYIAIGADLFFSWRALSDNGTLVYETDETNLFGSNHQNTNIYLEVKYKWGIDINK